MKNWRLKRAEKKHEKLKAELHNLLLSMVFDKENVIRNQIKKYRLKEKITNLEHKIYSLKNRI